MQSLALTVLKKSDFGGKGSCYDKGMANSVTKTKLRAVGDEVAVILSKDIMTEMNLKPDDEIFLVKTDKGYTITSQNEDVEEALKVAKGIVDRYQNTFRELAK